MTSAAFTSWPLPLKRTSSNRVRRAGSPLSEISLRRTSTAASTTCEANKLVQSVNQRLQVSYLEESSLGCGLFTVFLLAAGTSASLETSPCSASASVTQPSISVVRDQSKIWVYCPCAHVLNWISFIFYHQQTALHHLGPTGLGAENVDVDEKPRYLKGHFLLGLTWSNSRREEDKNVRTHTDR